MPRPAHGDPRPPALPPAGAAALLYQCRACSTRFPANPVGDAPGMFKAVLAAYNTGVGSDTGRLPLAVGHACPDGAVGLADFVGVMPGR